MNDGAQPDTAAARASEPLPVVNVLVIYQGRDMAARGVRIYRNLVHALCHGWAFELHLWPFFAFTLAEFAQRVTRHAMEADVIMLCARDLTHVPEDVKFWFEHWRASRPPTDCAIVILTDGPAPIRRDTEDWLFVEKLSRQSGITLFPAPRNAGTHGDSRPAADAHQVRVVLRPSAPSPPPP